jgi:hypothetical protein
VPVAKDDFEAKIAMELASMCEALHCLPQAGGLLDQDSYYVYMLQAVLAANQKKHEMEQAEREVKRGGTRDS